MEAETNPATQTNIETPGAIRRDREGWGRKARRSHVIWGSHAERGKDEQEGAQSIPLEPYSIGGKKGQIRFVQYPVFEIRQTEEGVRNFLWDRCGIIYPLL